MGKGWMGRQGKKREAVIKWYQQLHEFYAVCLSKPYGNSPLVLQLPCPHVQLLFCPVPTECRNQYLSDASEVRHIRVFTSNPREHEPNHLFSPISHQNSTCSFFLKCVGIQMFAFFKKEKKMQTEKMFFLRIH